MEIPKIFPCEYQFCLILWEYEPISSTKLVSICRDKLNWSKSTTYTVIKRLVARGIMQNEQTVCTSKITRNQAEVSIVLKFADEYFSGDYLQIERVILLLEE